MKSPLCWAALLAAVLAPVCACAQEPAFSVKDDIAMVRFNEPSADPDMPAGNQVQASPDGKSFAVVTTRGLLETDQVESQIWIFERRALQKYLDCNFRTPPPRPYVIAEIRSFPHREQPSAYAPVISELRWAPDNVHLYFRGENPRGANQVYVADLRRKRFEVITPPDRNVDQYAVGTGRIVYTASALDTPATRSAEFRISQDAEVVTGRRLQDVLFPHEMKTIEPEEFTLAVSSQVAGAWVNRTVPGYSVRAVPYLSFLFPFVLSPQGDKLLTLVPVDHIPSGWARYRPASGYPWLRFSGDDVQRTEPGNLMRPEEYAVVDLKTGKVTPLIEAPNARALAYLANNRAAWSPDGESLVVTNTFLPIGDDVAERKYPCAVAIINLPTFQTNCVMFDMVGSRGLDQVQEIAFHGSSRVVQIVVGTASGPKKRLLYEQLQGKWHLVSHEIFEEVSRRLSADRLQRHDPVVFLRQGLNEPPTLWIRDVTSGAEHQLWDPNPQLRNIQFGQASVYRWMDRTGMHWTGALVKPVGYVPGKRYPLILQMYSFTEGQFLTDGTDPTGFAARELASVGFMVLQIRKKPDTMTESDPEQALNGYRSAIDSLARAGFVDRARVGATGFSWTCWYVENALIKDPSLFAAARVADGLDNSFFQYVLIADGSPPIRRQMEAIRGGSPFGPGLSSWIATAPDFHMDRIKAPVRIEAINPLSLLQEWDLYSLLHLQNKPVDFIYFPRGTHIHQKPLERLESQQGNIDWFRFWLQGYEDPSPAKRQQYRRWEELKRLRRSAAKVPEDELAR